MVISDSRRLLFVHVQKTGGSTIDRTLSSLLPDVRRLPQLDRHAPLGAVLREEPGLSAYWTVGFVRNPWARLLSWHRMADRFRRGAEAGNPPSVKALESNVFLRTVAEEYPDFESFVLRGPDRFRRLRVPQVQYLTSRTRRADFVGRQETLVDDMRAVLARLELPPAPLSETNVDRARPDYREVYTEPMRRRVEELFASDIAAFDYRF